MSIGSKQELLAAQRKIGFLKTFEKKFQGLRRELERLQRAAEDPGIFRGRWPTGGLDRITRSLVNTAVLNDLPQVTAWSRAFQTRLEKINSSEEKPAGEDLEWLATQLQELKTIRDEALSQAEQIVAANKPASITPEAARPRAISMPAPSPTDSIGAKSVLPVVQSTAVIAVATVSLAKQAALILKRAEFDIQPVEVDPTVVKKIRDISPDLVIIDEEDQPPGGKALIDALGRDSLTDYIPVLKLTASSEKARRGSVAKPIVSGQLVKEARRVIGPESQSFSVAGTLKNTNLTELLEYVQRELESGVIEASLGPHTSMRFAVAEEAPLIAATWDLIACLRRSAATGSKGKIRFVPTSHGRVGMMALAEAEEVLDPASYDSIDEANLNRLAGLKVVVADDDVEIREAFKKTLAEAGMTVRVAKNGIEALKLVREEPPDLLITDILMPQMDGWELANCLKHDFALKRLPIIVLSWKHDFLQRIRELKMVADDFMLKEIDRQQILRRIARVLKPRFALAQQLEAGADVSGRAERLGILTILYEAMRLRPDCRVTFRENWNYFEVDVAQGELTSVTRTGSDGSYHSGMPALEILLGVSGGRFSIVNPIDNPKQMFKQGTQNAVQKATERLNELVAHVINGALMHIERIELDPELMQVYAQIVPPKLKQLLEQLQKGISPRKIILSSAVSPDVLEVLLLDLIHRGTVQNITSTPSFTPQADWLDSWQSPEEENAPGPPAVPFAQVAAAPQVPQVPQIPQTPEVPPVRQTPGVPPVQDPPQPPVVEGPPSDPPEPQLPSEPPRNTIPLTIEDISEIGAQPVQPRPTHGVALPLVPQPKPPASRAWRLFALLLIIGLGVSLYFNYQNWFPGTDSIDTLKSALNMEQTSPGAVEPSEPPAEPVEQPTAPAESPAAEPSEPVVADPPVEEPVATEATEEPGQPTPEKTRRESEPKRRRRATEPKRKVPQFIPKRTPRNDPPPKKPDPPEKRKPAKKAEPKGATGTLFVTVPPGVAGPIRISVDGKLRGRAPIQIRLPPGLHEVVFNHGGKRTMRMVTIKAGGIKSIAAKVSQ